MNKSPCCNAELKGYTANSYPYESGYKCTCCGAEFSYLQVSRGALEKPCEPWAICKHPTKHNWKAKEEKLKEQAKEQALKDHLNKPQDISSKPLKDQADILTLAFIGMIAMPIGISKEVLEKCCEAFNNNRGQVEWEAEAILEVLKNEIKNNSTR